MRTWRQSILEVRCGACGNPIPAGQAYLEFRISQVTTRKLRCVECAGEPPPQPTAGPLTAAMIHFGRFL